MSTFQVDGQAVTAKADELRRYLPAVNEVLTGVSAEDLRAMLVAVLALSFAQAEILLPGEPPAPTDLVRVGNIALGKALLKPNLSVVR
jgi:hypothetical protein